MRLGDDRLRRAAAAVAAGAGLVTAACGGSPSAALPPAASSPAPAVSASPSPAGPVAPLTGLPIEAATAARPVVAVVVSGSQPLGLSDADVIYQEITSPVRYIALFQSEQASAVGPVSSTRPEDGQILSVLRPLVGYDGGTTSFISVLDQASVVDLGYGTHTSLYSDGSAGLTASTATLQGAGQAAAPPELLAYRGAITGSDALASTGQSRASAVTIQFPGADGTEKWTFDAQHDLWQQTGGGPSIEVANLIVQIVPFINVFLSRRYSQTAPSARVIGRGGANSVEAFSGIADSTAQGTGGLAAAGAWSKPGLHDVTEYLDAAGLPMDFQPGTTWIILAPPGTRVTATNAAP